VFEELKEIHTFRNPHTMAAPFHDGDVTSAITIARTRGTPLLVALMGTDPASQNLTAAWSNSSSPLHGELTGASDALGGVRSTLNPTP